MLLLTWTSTAIFHTSAVCGSGYSMVTPHCLTLTATQGGSLNYPKCTSKEKCNKILLILTLYLKNTTSDTYIQKNLHGLIYCILIVFQGNTATSTKEENKYRSC